MAKRSILKSNLYTVPLLEAFVKANPHFSEDEAVQHPAMRFAEAYLLMADAKYRPAAPGDGMGNIYMSVEDSKDRLGGLKRRPRAVKISAATIRLAKNAIDDKSKLDAVLALADLAGTLVDFLSAEDRFRVASRYRDLADHAEYME